MTAPDDVELVPVHVLRMPLGVHARAQEHSDELSRELTLIAQQLHSGDSDQHTLPDRLSALTEELTARYGMFTGEQETALTAALERGDAVMDLHYEVPRSVADAARHLGALLDEVDDYCRAGQHLLSLATPAELVRYRRWFLDQFIDQAQGHPPVAWEDYP